MKPEVESEWGAGPDFGSGRGLPSKRMIHVGNQVRAVSGEGED